MILFLKWTFYNFQENYFILCSFILLHFLFQACQIRHQLNSQVKAPITYFQFVNVSEQERKSPFPREWIDTDKHFPLSYDHQSDLIVGKLI